jgi:hypothetical protein
MLLSSSSYCETESNNVLQTTLDRLLPSLPLRSVAVKRV